jgi:hypothetical protein
MESPRIGESGGMVATEDKGACGDVLLLRGEEDAEEEAEGEEEEDRDRERTEMISWTETDSLEDDC